MAMARGPQGQDYWTARPIRAASLKRKYRARKEDIDGFLPHVDHNDRTAAVCILASTTEPALKRMKFDHPSCPLSYPYTAGPEEEIDELYH